MNSMGAGLHEPMLELAVALVLRAAPAGNSVIIAIFLSRYWRHIQAINSIHGPLKIN